MPVLPRQLGIQSLVSQALESRISTASEALFSTTPVVAPTPVVSTTPIATVPALTQTTPLVTLTPSDTPVTSAVVSQTPTISVIVITTTTTPLTSATPAVTSSSDILSSTTPISSLVVPTPTPVATPDATTVPTTTRPVSSASASATGAPANAGAGAQTQADKGMSGGIIALIVVGALLAALLAGAFAFRRIQVYRRAKRRENNYGAGPVSDTSPFPFTNVSETDLKGAEPITRDFRQGSAPSLNEKQLPAVAPVAPYGAPSSNFGQPMMSGPYPVMGSGAGYGYGQPGRTASPAPSQAPRMMSPALPPAAYMRTGSPALSGPPPNQYPQAPTPAPAPPVPAEPLPAHLRGRKRVVQTFQPTLPDELDIREGDWVTIVHAYDDGWGLCERNGRRGVVPLECLDLGRSEVRASRRMSSLSAIRQ